MVVILFIVDDDIVVSNKQSIVKIMSLRAAFFGKVAREVEVVGFFMREQRFRLSLKLIRWDRGPNYLN